MLEPLHEHVVTHVEEGNQALGHPAMGMIVASAERFATLVDGAGIPVGETLSWSTYPWYVNRLPRAAELEAGLHQDMNGCSICREQSEVTRSPSALAGGEHHDCGRHDLKSALLPEFFQDIVEDFHPGRHDSLTKRLARWAHNISVRKPGASRPMKCFSDFRKRECPLRWIGVVELGDQSQYGLFVEAGERCHRGSTSDHLTSGMSGAPDRRDGPIGLAMAAGSCVDLA